MTSSKPINHQKRILVREDDRPITIKEKLKELAEVENTISNIEKDLKA